MSCSSIPSGEAPSMPKGKRPFRAAAGVAWPSLGVSKCIQTPELFIQAWLDPARDISVILSINVSSNGSFIKSKRGCLERWRLKTRLTSKRGMIKIWDETIWRQMGYLTAHLPVDCGCVDSLGCSKAAPSLAPLWEEEVMCGWSMCFFNVCLSSPTWNSWNQWVCGSKAEKMMPKQLAPPLT